MINYFVNLFPELFTFQNSKRIPEPMLMVDEEQVQAYFDYAANDSTMLASYIYHAAGATPTFAGCRNVLDLGCGPATQLVILAEMNPQIQFIGIDLSETMLTRAEQFSKERNVRNITFIHDDISKLGCIKNDSVDGIFSTVAFHHLPTVDHLNSTFQNMQRVITSRKAVYITDFALLGRVQTMEFIVNLNQNQPEYFRQDYLNSLRAAFPLSEFKKNKKLYFSEKELGTTFMIPFMFILKSSSKNIPSENKYLRELFSQLSPQNQKLFRDIYYFFRLGGVTNPFAQNLLSQRR